MINTIIFDLDETLVRCGEYYWEARRKFSDVISLETGISPTIADNILKSIDLQSMAIDGFGRDRFPRSFSAASVAIDVLVGRKPSLSRAKKCWSIGNSVFKAPYPLYPGVIGSLQEIKDMEINMFVCTKGDYRVQLSKIKKNNLNRFFSDSHIYVNLTKEPSHFLKIIKEHKLSTSSTVLIGDSLKEDIGAAQTLGIYSVWVKDNRRIEYDHDPNNNESKYSPTWIIGTIKELPSLLKDINST